MGWVVIYGPVNLTQFTIENFATTQASIAIEEIEKLQLESIFLRLEWEGGTTQGVFDEVA